MNLLKLLFLVGFVCLYTSLFAQIDYSANTHTSKFDYPFGFGSNLGVYPGWTDENLAALITGDPIQGIIGASGNTIRPFLPEHFLETWGYGIRKETFKYYSKLGLQGVVAFVGYPSKDHQDTLEHCTGSRSNMFLNMYTPIWDNGENGTPVNDTNYYALYLYNTIQMYGDHVDIWEISNEPDLSGSPSSYQGPEVPTSWWNQDPNPCDIALQAPIQSYIRMLRISYEVIKSEQPDDLVAVGGLGYASFLDGILRNTDNQDDGKITSEYPLKGGAYFDVMSFHTYPHIDGSTREWSVEKNDFVYFRHSDRAINHGYIETFIRFRDVLTSHGYNGLIFPMKHYIVTETNIPNKEYGEFMGTIESQRNFTIKCILKSMEYDIRQVHFFTIAEEGEFFTQEFSYMGLYKKLGASIAEKPEFTEQGIAFKTTALLTKGYYFNREATNALDLPADVDGLALKNSEGEILYALWAKTYLDKSEKTSATYDIPTTDSANVMAIYNWDYSITHQVDTLPGNLLALNGTPTFFRPLGNIKIGFKLQQPSISPNPTDLAFQLSYRLFGEAEVQASLYNSLGQKVRNIIPKTYQFSGPYEQTVSTEYLPPGMYTLRLKAKHQVALRKILVIH